MDRFNPTLVRLARKQAMEFANRQRSFNPTLVRLAPHEIWPKKAKFRRLLCRRPPVPVKGARNDGT